MWGLEREDPRVHIFQLLGCWILQIGLSLGISEFGKGEKTQWMVTVVNKSSYRLVISSE